MQYHFFSTIKKYTKALLDSFNDILVTRSNSKYHKVPITFAAKDPSYVLSEAETESLLTGNLNIFPRMSLALETLEPLNTNRGLNRIDYTKAGKSFIYNSFGIELNYVVIVEARSMTELTEILEQILPFFTPTLNLRIDELDGLQEPTSIKVELTTVDIDLPIPENNDIRVCAGTIRLKLHGNLYPRISEPSLIEHVKINMGMNDMVVSTMSGNVTENGVIEADSYFKPIDIIVLENLIVATENRNNEIIAKITPKFDKKYTTDILTTIYNLIYTENINNYNRIEKDGSVFIIPNNKVIISVQIVMKNGEYSNRMEVVIKKDEKSNITSNVITI